MAKGIKFKYYVATIGNDGRYYYVTDIDNSTKTFWRDAKKEAKAFSKAWANDMQFAMSVNGYVTLFNEPEYELCYGMGIKVDGESEVRPRWADGCYAQSGTERISVQIR